MLPINPESLFRAKVTSRGGVDFDTFFKQSGYKNRVARNLAKRALFFDDNEHPKDEYRTYIKSWGNTYLLKVDKQQEFIEKAKSSFETLYYGIIDKVDGMKIDKDVENIILSIYRGVPYEPTCSANS